MITNKLRIANTCVFKGNLNWNWSQKIFTDEPHSSNKRIRGPKLAYDISISPFGGVEKLKCQVQTSIN